MPVSSPLIPKSTLRHRPLGFQTAIGEPPRVPRASRTQQHPSKVQTTTPEEIPVWKQARKSRSGWQQQRLLFLGIGMTLAVLIVFVGQLLMGWVSTTSDDLHYGRPRTFQTDAFVGHETGTQPSHFIALNLQGRIEIIELPGGDAAHARIFVGPHLYGQNADLVPITLQFVDTQHNHHPDMLVLFQGTRLTYRNEQGTFHPG
ncbi:MAG TPA: hypothetical protein VEL31_24190 [Ktedonobacteraceae bacterium]|nr:hypothetical protein [Ktedonobacteraceae bacterium]